MTNVAVLVGFSCSGKSSAARPLKKRGDIEVLDTDIWICERLGVCHIYELYLRGRDEALAAIEDSERAFLRTWEPGSTPALIAAGPFLPVRPEWEDFARRVGPECIQITVTAEQALDSLLGRHEDQRKVAVIRDSPLAFSWDQGITTEHTDEGWQLVPRTVALGNIEQQLTSLAPFYGQAARHDPARRLQRGDDEGIRAKIDDILFAQT